MSSKPVDPEPVQNIQTLVWLRSKGVFWSGHWAPPGIEMCGVLCRWGVASGPLWCYGSSSARCVASWQGSAPVTKNNSGVAHCAQLTLKKFLMSTRCWPLKVLMDSHLSPWGQQHHTSHIHTQTQRPRHHTS